ncbi:tyrosine-type recombinase/integrase [Actinomadura rupiterrae]|uniref:tyrosine-type recombinase/integrase n=1 Tax=Actinomadura rupiterrae TaxID=559627 RepID=UPI0020A39B53|nr:site-specific integrase [Actinomadura rupiterrae]MCP2339238.1 integrase [Actinomadura rupiterrae]
MASYRKLPSGLWQATVYMPNGRRTTETDKLKSVVKEWAGDLEMRYKRGEQFDPRAGRITVKEWRERVVASRHLEAPTIRKHASIWRTHCEEEWADWPMNAVARQEAQEWVNRLRSTRRARHKGRATGDADADVPFLSAATVHEAVFLMTSLYKAGMNAHPPIITRNPFAALDLPRIEPQPVQFYEREEARALYEAAGRSSRRARLLIELGMDVGLRPGEIYGLHTDRMDWKRNLIEVTRVMTRDGLREYPKSRMSHRTVPARKELMEQIAKELGAGRKWAGACTCRKVLPDGTTLPGKGPCKGLVFPAPGGGPIDDGNFRDRVWNPAVAAAGIRRFPPKIMRHTAASHLVQDGVPLYEVQHLLGHESPATTQKYAHLAPDAHEKIRDSWKRREGS